MRKKVKVTKKLAAAGLAAILACQVMGCGTGEAFFDEYFSVFQ